MTPKEAAKLKIREWNGQIDGLMERLRAHQITPTVCSEKVKLLRAKIEGVQSVFNMVNGI
jgi:hypothetical protein